MFLFDHLHSTLLRVFSSAVLGGEINPSNARSSLNNLAPLHLLPSHWTAMANARLWRRLEHWVDWELAGRCCHGVCCFVVFLRVSRPPGLRICVLRISR